MSAHEEREGRIRLPEDGEVSNGNGNLDEQVDAGEEEEEDNEDWERLSVSTDGSDQGKDTKPKKKKKGEDGADAKEKKKKVPFTVANVTKRFYRLFPYLWPSKSFRLQVCAFLSLACTFTSVAFNIVEPMLWGRIVQSLSEGNSACSRSGTPAVAYDLVFWHAQLMDHFHLSACLLPPDLGRSSDDLGKPFQSRSTNPMNADANPSLCDASTLSMVRIPLIAGALCRTPPLKRLRVVVEDILWAPVDLWVSKEMELMAMRHVLRFCSFQTFRFHRHALIEVRCPVSRIISIWTRIPGN